MSEIILTSEYSWHKFLHLRQSTMSNSTTDIPSFDNLRQSNSEPLVNTLKRLKIKVLHADQLTIVLLSLIMHDLHSHLLCFQRAYYKFSYPAWYYIMLYRIHLAKSGIQTDNWWLVVLDKTVWDKSIKKTYSSTYWYSSFLINKNDNNHNTDKLLKVVINTQNPFF